jgi:murein DD-endopeptidase MepM/ murein hydrolase activator NlpD
MTGRQLDAVFARSVDVRVGRVAGVAIVCAIAALACTPIARTGAGPGPAADGSLIPPDDPVARGPIGDPLSCVQRATTPQVDNAFDAVWAPDSQRLAVSVIRTIENPRMVTGTEEQQRIVILDLAKGTTSDLGQGNHPSWSGSGTYLSYWREGDDDLRVVRGNALVALIPSTQPSVRWVGDTLYFFHDDELRSWKEGVSWTIAHVGEDLQPKYPHDDVYFSADGERFTLTRYYSTGDVERYLGTTATGEMGPVGDGNTLFTQWSPVGHDLLLRSVDAVTLRASDGSTRSADARTLAGAVHAWSADGKLFFGAMSPTLAPAIDRFVAFDDGSVVAKLPNLLGIRAFSPNGQFFVGTSRTGLYATELDVYRCGTTEDSARADTSARAGLARIEADSRRFVRPVSGAVTQYVQGSHTGIDVSAPVGAIIVAADDGTVDAVGLVPVGGRRVCVLHDGGLESCDYHTSLPLVSIGDHVTRGQPVALIGMTGMTTGPHVHWEAKRNEMIVDPLKQ